MMASTSVGCSVVIVYITLYNNNSRVPISRYYKGPKTSRSVAVGVGANQTIILQSELSSLTNFPYRQVDYNFRLPIIELLLVII